MNKFKRDAEILGSIRPDDYPSQDQFIAIGNAADFFDSIATLANEAPDQGYFVSLKTASSKQIDYVLKEYSDYWQQKCYILLADKQDMCSRAYSSVDNLKVELQTAYKHINELKSMHNDMCTTANKWHSELDVAQQRIKQLEHSLLDNITA